MKRELARVRNIGISAHIDAGKTTLTERILYYTQRIHAMHDVRGKDGVGATMDFMELERERGITIASAATYAAWKDFVINIIDTPGHVDFTIEVERALRVLDGAVLVLCAVGGVQSQSITVDRQMARYKVPCIAFVNKCDRVGANPFRVAEQLKTKLLHNPVLMQIPIGLEGDFTGIVDLVKNKALYFDGEGGEQIRQEEVPESLKSEVAARREALIDAASMHDDELMEEALEGGQISQALLVRAIRKAALERKITPVFMGSAYKNKGVQPLLDAVTLYLPHPGEVENTALDLAADSAPVNLIADDKKPLVALAFKLEDGRFGQLTYMRIYQGSLQKSDTVQNSRTAKKIKVGRLVRMHASQMEDIEILHAGDIGAIFGVDCASGDTFTDPKLHYSMTSMHVPKPVISLSITPSDNKAQMQMSKALSRFVKEDPTFTSHVDAETGETLIAGMGELHLDVYVERMRREYGAQVTVGRPQVAFRETITSRAEFDYTHRKQTGGAGQYAKVVGYIEPASEGDFEFVNEVRGGTVPTQFIPACEKGFASSLQKGPLVGFPITGVRIVLNDGNSHAVDSSEMAFSTAARMAFRECYPKAGPVIMEPIMKVAVETPTEFQGSVMGSLNQRRGIIAGTMEEGAMTVIEADVPLSEMFGYATALRSLTQGKAQFTMEFAQYRKVPESVAVALKEKHREATGRD